MNSDELKCLELFLRHFITNNNALDSEISDEFESAPERYEQARSNLFNQITINNLLQNLGNKPSFSLKLFKETGKIPNIYEKEMPIPVIDYPEKINYKDFYKYLREALEDGNYIFDTERNIIISSSNLQATIPELWLYFLSEALREESISRFFFFNKHDNIKIRDVEDLKTYLKHCKTFKVDVVTPDPNADVSKELDDIEEQINETLDYRSQVKIEDLVQNFMSKIPKEYTTKIGRYKADNYYFLITKANAEPDFYHKPLKEQNALLNKWLIEYTRSNQISNDRLQRFLLTQNTSEEEKDNLIIGLFMSYIDTLTKLELDYDNIDLKDFNIETYESDEAIKRRLSLMSLRQQRKYAEQEFARNSKDISSLLDLVNEINDIDTEAINRRSKEYQQLQSTRLLQERSIKSIDSELQEEQTSLEKTKREIDFLRSDKTRIINLIHRSTKEGIIHLSPDRKQLVIELYNEQLGRTTFKANISLDNLLLFVEDTNYDLQEVTVNLR